MADLKEGEEVRVFDVNIRRDGPGSWPGRVEKVGRTLAHISYRGRTETFLLSDGRRNDKYGHQRFRTLGQVAEDDRRAAALKILWDHGVKLGLGCRLSLRQIEALAAVLSGSDNEEARDG